MMAASSSSVEPLREILKSCLDSILDDIGEGLNEESLRDFASDLFSDNLISGTTREDPNYNAIKEELKSKFDSLKTQERLEEFCFNIVTVMERSNGYLKEASKQLEESFVKESKEKLDLTLNIKKTSIQETESNNATPRHKPLARPPKAWPTSSHELGRTLRRFPDIKTGLGESDINSSHKPMHLVYNEMVTKTYYNRENSEVTHDYKERSVWSFSSDQQTQQPMSDPQPVSPYDFLPVFEERRGTAATLDPKLFAPLLENDKWKSQIVELQKKLETSEKERARLEAELGKERLNKAMRNIHPPPAATINHDATSTANKPHAQDVQDLQEGEMVPGGRASAPAVPTEETSENAHCCEKDCLIAALKVELKEKSIQLNEKEAHCQELKKEKDLLLSHMLNEKDILLQELMKKKDT